MKKSLTFLTAASVAAIAAPAAAQSADTDTFTGPRAAVIVGYDTTRAGSDIDDDTNEDNDQSIDGVVYGVALGYDWDLGGAVVGVDAELTDSTAEVESDDGDFEGFGLGDVGTARDLYLGIRAGAKVSDQALLYAKGGYTNAKYNFQVTGTDTDLDTDFDTDGYRLGAGVEYAVSERAFVNLEYRYSNYSEAEVDFEDDDLPDSERVDVDLDRHQIVASAGIRF